MLSEAVLAVGSDRNPLVRVGVGSVAGTDQEGAVQVDGAGNAGLQSEIQVGDRVTVRVRNGVVFVIGIVDGLDEGASLGAERGTGLGTGAVLTVDLGLSGAGSRSRSGLDAGVVLTTGVDLFRVGTSHVVGLVWLCIEDVMV